MTNKEAIRAEYGKPMDLMTREGYPYFWNGQSICFMDGGEAPNMDVEWRNAEAYDDHDHLYTRAGSARFLPPLEPVEAEVGMEVCMKSTGKRPYKVLRISGQTMRLELPSQRPYMSEEWQWRNGKWVGERYDMNGYGSSEEDHFTCAKTGRPVVPPNPSETPNSSNESEPSLSDKGDGYQVSLSDSTEDLSDKQPKIEVGQYWKRNSDGKLCVVKSYSGNRNSEVLVEEGGPAWSCGARHLREFYTYLYTCNTAEDLRKLPSGSKLIDYETGEVVTWDGTRLYDSDGFSHSVNDLPSYTGPGSNLKAWRKHGALHRLKGAAWESDSGRREFYIDGEFYTPEEWADGATAEDVAEEYRPLIEAALERATCKESLRVERYSVEKREGKKFETLLVRDDYGDRNIMAKFYFTHSAEKVAELLNEAAAKEAGDVE